MPPPIKPKGTYEPMEPSPSKLVSEKEKEQQSKEKEQQSKEKEQQSREQQSREKEQRSKDRPERSRPSFKGVSRKAAEKTAEKRKKRGGGACENSGDKNVLPLSKIQNRTKVAPKLPSRDSVSKDSREGKGTRESMPDAFRSQEQPGLGSKQAADDLVNTQPEQGSPPKPKVAHTLDKKPEPLPLMIKKTAKTPNKTSDKDKKGKKPQEPDNGYDYLDPETKEDENIASKQGAKPKGGEEEEEEEEGTTTKDAKHANSIYDPSRMDDKLSKSQADKLTPDAPSREGDKRGKKKKDETQTRDATTLNDTDADREPKYEKLNFNANRLVNKDPSKFPKPPPSLPSRKKNKSQIKPLKRPEKVAQTPRAHSPDRATKKGEKRDKRDGQSVKEKRDTVMSVKENASLISKKQEPPPKASRLDFGKMLRRNTKGDAKEGEPPKEKKKGKLFQLPNFGTPLLPSQIQRKRAGSSGKEFGGRSLKQEVRSLTRILDKYEKQHM